MMHFSREGLVGSMGKYYARSMAHVNRKIDQYAEGGRRYRLGLPALCL